MGDKENGMMTKIWGPPGWFFLHIVSFGYPYEITSENSHRIREYAKFFNSLGHILPCKYCRNSYNEYIKEYPVEKFLNSRESLTKWLYIIHNRVNDKLGVPECDRPSFEEVKKKYEQYRAKCKQTTNKEREERLIKGCTIPENGIKKRCLINIVNDTEHFTDNCDYNFYIIFILYIIAIILILFNVLKALNIL